MLICGVQMNVEEKAGEHFTSQLSNTVILVVFYFW